MQLSFLKNKTHKNQETFILIVSESLKHLDNIYEYLCLKGIDNSKKLHKNPLEIQPCEIKWHLQAVILDALNVKDTQEYCDFIAKIFPKNIPCIVLANNDSIKISQEFLSEGIFYLDRQTQSDQIYEKIFSFEENIQNKKSIKISILGAKGGVGNSFISYHLACMIYQRYLSCVLNVQGSESSFNLDFISGKIFEKEYYHNNEVCLFRETKEDAYNYHNPKHAKFNFILYDHSIQSLQKESIETILNESDTVVLLINYELDCLRKAKETLRINEFLLSVNQGAKKIYICVNQGIPHIKSTLCISDLEEIIGASIDSVIPYQPIDKSAPTTIPKGKTNKALELLVDKLTGTISKRKRKWI
ncbi:hypothetical protein [Helicobacter sp. 11S03491-1]|uniref:hypothetical protein n=1 Tax=Helicobacter sp. 11S03491-1 TaxID=1476196 RepID=UPI000BA6601C|nr:hypothetical protein [Helicobacter sp. 11S03491-1]PAF43370.1 hypothetical protein BKH45_01650 [Helicobacter sp. 11S03491-1]